MVRYPSCQAAVPDLFAEADSYVTILYQLA
jgi:hypothetical protein